MKKRFLLIILLFFILLPTAPLLANEDGYCDWIYSEINNITCKTECRNLNEKNCREWSSGGCCQWKTDMGTAKDNLTGNIPITSDVSKYQKKDLDDKTALKFTPQVKIPGIMEEIIFKESSTRAIAKLVKNLLNYAITIIGLLSLIIIIFGGALWAISSGSSSKVNEARQWIFSGLGGLLLILFSYTLLGTINVNLVNLKATSVKTIEKKTIILDNKSDFKKGQLYDDCSYFDQTYINEQNLISDTRIPARPACCFVYRSVDNIHEGVSFFYTPDMYSNLQVKCIEYARNLLLNVGSSRADKLAGPDLVASLSSAGAPISFAVKNPKAKSLFISSYKNFTPKSIYNIPKNFKTSKSEIRSLDSEDFQNLSNDVIIMLIDDAPCWLCGTYIEERSRGLDNENYCTWKVDYEPCMLKDETNKDKRLWGYCFKQTCHQCNNYGQEAPNDYTCPNQNGQKTSASDCMSNFMCGSKANGKRKDKKCKGTP